MSEKQVYRDLILQGVEVAFCSLAKPKENKFGGKERFELTVRVPKDNKDLLKQIGNTYREIYKQKFGQDLSNDDIPLRDGAIPSQKEKSEGKQEGRFPNDFLLTGHSYSPIPVSDRSNQPIEADAVWSPDLVNFSVNLATYEAGKSRGVTTYGNAVQLIEVRHDPINNKGKGISVFDVLTPPEERAVVEEAAGAAGDEDDDDCPF